jgi:cytochrome c551/c552
MKSKFIFVIALFVPAFFLQASGNPVEEGKTLFMSRCAACHSVKKPLIGPALAGIDEKRSIDWIVNFVRSSQTMIKDGDKDAIAVFEQFNKLPMPDHPDLTEEKIASILEYIKSQSGGGTDKNNVFKPAKKITSLPLSLKKDVGYLTGFLAVTIMLVIALLFAVQSTAFRRQMHGENKSA